MKKILLAAAALMLVGPAMADDLKTFHTQSKFETAYSGIVDDARAQGFNVQMTCWKDYCQHYVQAQYKDGFSMAKRLVYANGGEVREFCVSKSVAALDRNCADSIGHFWSERYNNAAKTWNTGQMFATHFEDETGAADQSM